MVAFKLIGIEELPKVRKIAYETWPDTFEKLLSKEQISYMLDLMYHENSLNKQMVEKGHQFLLVEQDGQSLGFTSYELNCNNEPQLMIHKLYVLPIAQGLGIGTRLLHILAETAHRNNNKRLRLKVYFENTKAIGFYEKFGFKKIGIEMTDLGNSYSILDYIMVMELNDYDNQQQLISG